MLSQQNPLEVVQYSLEQQMGSNDNKNDPITKPFSIRHYVLAARQKNVSHSWPFPEKYLQVCLKHGITNVLPPLEPHDSAREEGLSSICHQKEKGNAVYIENNFTKIECDSYYVGSVLEVSRQVCDLSLSSDSCKYGEKNYLCSEPIHDPMVPRIQPSTIMPSLNPHVDQSTEAPVSTKKLRHKRRKRKGRLKKRSMVDICAVAKHCTLEDLDRLNRLGCYSMKPPENLREGSVRMEHGCKSGLMEECSKEMHQSDENATAHDNLLGKKRPVLKIKFSGCKSKSWKRRLNSSKTVHQGRPMVATLRKGQWHHPSLRDLVWTKRDQV